MALICAISAASPGSIAGCGALAQPARDNAKDTSTKRLICETILDHAFYPGINDRLVSDRAGSVPIAVDDHFRSWHRRHEPDARVAGSRADSGARRQRDRRGP